MFERPKTVKDLGDPELFVFHQSGEIHPAVPMTQQGLQLFELRELGVIGLPAQTVP
jgi:hypothetical protein